MNAISPLFKSTAALASDGLQRFMPETLIFTAQDLPATGTHILPLVCDTSLAPGQVMQAVADWLNEYNVFDQRHLHGDDWARFKITGYCQYDNPGAHRSIISDVFLMEHLFADCRDHTPGSFDEFMRILDRHKMAEEIFRDLLYYRDYEPPGDHARLWLEGFRACCHPDYPRPSAGRAAPAVAVAVPA